MKKNVLVIGELTIIELDDWNSNSVRIEINNYDYDSTELNLKELTSLYRYIKDILKQHKVDEP